MENAEHTALRSERLWPGAVRGGAGQKIRQNGYWMEKNTTEMDFLRQKSQRRCLQMQKNVSQFIGKFRVPDCQLKMLIFQKYL